MKKVIVVLIFPSPAGKKHAPIIASLVIPYFAPYFNFCLEKPEERVRSIQAYDCISERDQEN